jgi:RimJ/RimL family protein N-acetyltransferase
MDNLNHDAVLQTARLRLRPIAPADEDDFDRLFADPDVVRYLGDPRNRPETAVAIQTAVDHWQARGYGIWVLTERATGGFVGRVGLRFAEDVGETELLYTLNKAFWGRGLATEAGAAALDFGFGRAGLGRVIALADPRNVGSWRVMEKLGMRREKVAPFRGEECVWYATDPDAFAAHSAKQAPGRDGHG